MDQLDRQLQQLLPDKVGDPFKVLSENDVKELCDKAKVILREEPNVNPVPAPCTVVGDNHLSSERLRTEMSSRCARASKQVQRCRHGGLEFANSRIHVQC